MTETDTRTTAAAESAVAEPAAGESVASAAHAAVRQSTSRRRPRLPHRPFRLRVGSIGALAVVAVLLAGVAGWLAVQLRSDAADRSRDEAILAVARQTVVNLLTIEPSSTDAAMTRLRRSATGEFAQQLIAQTDAFRQVVDGAHVTATGGVSEAGLKAITDDQATVLLSAVGTVKNDEAPQGEPRQYRMRLDLQHQPDGAWLVSKLDFVP
jgi:Mce-associated membrane protein